MRSYVSYRNTCSAPLESVSRQNIHVAKLPSLQFASIIRTQYTVSLYASRSAIVCHQIGNRVKTRKDRWRQVLLWKRKGMPKTNIKLHSKQQAHSVVLLSQLRSANICNKIRNRSKTRQVTCRQNAPLESVSSRDLGVGAAIAKKLNESFSTNTRPNTLKLGGWRLHTCCSNVSKLGRNRIRMGEVDFAPHGPCPMGQLPHAFMDSFSRTAGPNGLKLSQSTLHICPQNVFEFERDRIRTAEVDFCGPCLMPHAMGQLPHAFSESISSNT
jgi:hypothetical protein